MYTKLIWDYNVLFTVIYGIRKLKDFIEKFANERQGEMDNFSISWIATWISDWLRMKEMLGLCAIVKAWTLPIFTTASHSFQW